MEIKDKIINEIRKIYDPELPVNIYELGFIYDIKIKDRKAEILFQSAQRALTPGQILAIYSGERLIGSGIYSHSELGRSMLSS